MKMRVLVKEKRETLGKEHYYAACPLSRALVSCKYMRNIREHPAILPRDIESYIAEGIQIEYIGRQCDVLDNMGATHVQDNKKPKKQEEME